MREGEPKDSVRLRAAVMMGKHYGLFTASVALSAIRRVN